MSVVQLSPACPHVGLVAELVRRRRTTKVAERSVRRVTKLE
jgi:hypothetical protein